MKAVKKVDSWEVFVWTGNLKDCPDWFLKAEKADFDPVKSEIDFGLVEFEGENYPRVIKTNVGDYVMLNSDGTIGIYTPDEFNQFYETV